MLMLMLMDCIMDRSILIAVSYKTCSLTWLAILLMFVGYGNGGVVSCRSPSFPHSHSLSLLFIYPILLYSGCKAGQFHCPLWQSVITVIIMRFRCHLLLGTILWSAIPIATHRKFIGILHHSHRLTNQHSFIVFEHFERIAHWRIGVCVCKTPLSSILFVSQIQMLRINSIMTRYVTILLFAINHNKLHNFWSIFFCCVCVCVCVCVILFSFMDHGHVIHFGSWRKWLPIVSFRS